MKGAARDHGERGVPVSSAEGMRRHRAMFGDRISLKELRRKGSSRDSLGGSIKEPLDGPTLLALLETVEAARRLDEHIVLNGGCHRDRPEHDSLHAALARFKDYEGDEPHRELVSLLTALICDAAKERRT